MIKLTKIVLINWMYFQKATLPLEGNAAIVGVNGTGKSTIIDAIQMLLLGNKASKFNANANAEKRSLESYVRGAVRTEEKEYLRPGDVVTYLAIEIELNANKHIFGINIDYKYNLSKLTDPKYFYIKGLDLSEDIFIKDNYPKTYDVFIKEMKSKYEYISFPVLYQYQIKLKEILGLKDEKKYFQTLSRAVGIKNITNCNDFMNEFVLDEEPIDVDSIKKIILDIEKVNSTIEREEKKYNSLDEIVILGNEIKNDINDFSEMDLKNDLASIILVENEVNKMLNDNNSYENLIESENNNKNIIEEDNNKLKELKIELKKSIDNISPDLTNKRKELEEKQKEYDKVHMNLNTFKTKCQNELANLSLLTKYKNPIFDEFYKYLENNEYTTAKAKQLFKDFRDELSALKNKTEYKTIKLESSIENIRNELLEVKNIIENLQNNKFTFNPKLEEFKNYLKETLEEKYNEKIEVNYLCEYLNITDESWHRAIEGYLNTQRFYIVVPNKYYKDALRIYHDKKDFYLTKIINGTKLPDFDYEEGVLGSFISSSNPTALNYARFILNRVHCADNIYELDKYDISVTKDCMYYQNYCVGRLNTRACDEQYIGISGLKSQLEQRLKYYDELNKEAIRIKNEYLKYKQMINIFDNEIKFSTNIIENNALLDSIDNDDHLFNQIQVLSTDISFYEANPQYIEIISKITSIDNELSNNNQKIKEKDNNISDYYANIKKNQALILEKNNSIELIKDKLEEIDFETKDQIKKELDKINISYSFINNLRNKQRILENKINKDKIDLEYKMKDVRNEYNLNYEPKFENLSNYIEEKEKIRQSVFSHKSKLIDFTKKNHKLFFNQFLSKLEKAIEKAKDEIDNLNHSLALFNFGNDYYKIKMNITEHPDFKLIYEYAKKYNSDDSNRGLFIDRDAEDRERIKIQDILNQYMFSDNPTISSMIVDYRKYLVFDVEVHTPNGVKYLNKVMKSQSGGEVQVPFYILSGVAFQQTLDYKRNKDSLGIVLYDEAFDKMDGQRIQAMLEFYRDKLNLQLVLATPGKLDSLVDNIETILVVVRDGETAIVSDVSHELR